MKLLALVLIAFLGLKLEAQQSLNVTNYGARGDAAWISVNCVSNSYKITSTNALSSADIGKAIEIFGGGPRYGSSYGAQDNLAYIMSVTSGTNIGLNRACQNTTNLTYAFYGTLCSTSFQACVNASSNSVINIPAGNYLMIPPALLDTNFVLAVTNYNQSAVTLYQYGQHFLGAGRTNTVLFGAGAYRAYPFNGSALVNRGFLFYEPGGESNYSGTLTFDSLTMDGGVAVGNQNLNGSPADYNGNGWDVTHGAILSGTTTPATNTVFVNCNIQHWRGEMLKSTYDFQSANFTGITNCNFIDGDASALNWQIGSHTVSSCLFSNVELVEEYEQHVGSLVSAFLNNTVTNCLSGLTISGANTNYLPQAPYLVQSNYFNVTNWGVNLSPAQNVSIVGNVFNNSGYAVLSGGIGGQGNAPISNILILNNVATNTGGMLLVYAGGWYYLTNNTLIGSGNVNFIAPYTYGPTYLYNNTASSLGSASAVSCGGSLLPLDDLSNKFPYYYAFDYGNDTNIISYTSGARHSIAVTQPGSKWLLDDLTPSQIPAGAEMVVTNYTGNTNLVVYLSATNPVFAVSVPAQSAFTSYWSTAAAVWLTNQPVIYVPAPAVFNASGNFNFR